jgi:hypothetical protein
MSGCNSAALLQRRTFLNIDKPHFLHLQFGYTLYYSDHQDEINAHIERNRIPDDRIDPLVKNR